MRYPVHKRRMMGVYRIHGDRGWGGNEKGRGRVVYAKNIWEIGAYDDDGITTTTE